VSIQDIRPNSQDTSNFYLANIYQAIADPNRPNISLPSSPPPFSPPNYAVWVNSLWFLSLVISLTCALLATLLQQWARRYLRFTQPRYSPHKRARIRAFFFEGVEKFLLPWVVEALPTMLHVSLFLFFSGLVVFLCNVSLTIFKLVLAWVGVCTAVYGCVTVMPLFRHDSPYYTPLTSLVWPVVIGIPFVTFRILRLLTGFLHIDMISLRFRYFAASYRKLLLQGMQKTAEETAMKSPSEIDTRAFMGTFDGLDEDHELEHFFAGLPGFRSSKVVQDPLPNLTRVETKRLFSALIGLLDRTFSSELLPESVKNRRAIICAKAVNPAEIPHAYTSILNRVAFEPQYGQVQSAEIVHIVRGWDNGKDKETPLYRRAIISCLIARAQRRDDRWFAIASDEMGISESDLRCYAAHGDSLSLAILIHVTRLQFSYFWTASAGFYFRHVLEAASKINVQDASPELRREFCALWNQIVLKAQNNNDRSVISIPARILMRIRNVYIALHQGTDSAPTRFSASTGDGDDILYGPASYPVCKVASHIHDNSVSATVARNIPHRSALLPTSLDLASPNAPFSSVPPPRRVGGSLTTLPPRDSSLRAHQTFRIPIASDKTMPHSTPADTSASGLPLSSTSPAAVSFQHNSDTLTPSDPPKLPSSASSDLVLDGMLLTGPPLSSHSIRLLTVILPRISSLDISYYRSQRFSRADICASPRRCRREQW
jgi:hypothetical protein